MPTDRRASGSAAESLALAYLEARGLTCLLRNYRCRLGEIDLVARDGSTLVLVEVRSRSSRRYGGAAGSVDARKQRRLVAAASHLLLTRPDLRRYPARFDVVAIHVDGTRSPQIDWIRDAFRL